MLPIRAEPIDADLAGHIRSIGIQDLHGQISQQNFRLQLHGGLGADPNIPQLCDHIAVSIPDLDDAYSILFQTGKAVYFLLTNPLGTDGISIGKHQIHPLILQRVHCDFHNTLKAQVDVFISVVNGILFCKGPWMDRHDEFRAAHKGIRGNGLDIPAHAYIGQALAVSESPFTDLLQAVGEQDSFQSSIVQECTGIISYAFNGTPDNFSLSILNFGNPLRNDYGFQVGGLLEDVIEYRDTSGPADMGQLLPERFTEADVGNTVRQLQLGDTGIAECVSANGFHPAWQCDLREFSTAVKSRSTDFPKTIR